jgi:protein ImuA
MLPVPHIPAQKADILAKLQKDILLLQAKPPLHSMGMGVDLGAINRAFPNGIFPTGAVHEYCCPSIEEANASTGFVAGILATLMQTGGACIWAAPQQTVFPAGLASFGIDPHKIIFVNLKREKELLWTIEEVLKCNGLAAVVGEVQTLSFMASRRLQLAVEESRVTGFVLRRNMRNMETTACAARWKITALPTALEEGMPGVGFPRWKVELLKVRNGKAGSWNVEWAGGQFHIVSDAVPVVQLQRRAV